MNFYKGNKNFVPPLYSDELSIFKSTNVYYNTCDSIYYNAYKDGKMVGRIHGIIQKQHNEITNEKRVRFTRFDSIDDVEDAVKDFDYAGLYVFAKREVRNGKQFYNLSYTFLAK